MSEVYWLSQAFDMIKRYVACVQAAFADPHLVRFEMTTNFGCALNAESIIDCLSQKKFYGERQKFCVHGIIGARQTGASNEHEHQTQFS